MKQCPKCGRETLVERSDIMPPPPGTDWPPQPREWVECTNCGYDSRPGHSPGEIYGRSTSSSSQGCYQVGFGFFIVSGICLVILGLTSFGGVSGELLIVGLIPLVLGILYFTGKLDRFM